MSYLEIPYGNLAAAGLFVVVAVALSRRERLDLERAMLIGSLRAVAQLLAVGYVLKALFDVDRWYLVLAMLTVMVLVAARSASQRIEAPIRGLARLLAGAITASLVVVMVPVVWVVLRLEAWYQPQYVVPISGMVIGNAMNAAALAVDRLVSDVRLRRDEIEAKLSLGAAWTVASAPCRRAALRTALMPTINAITVYGVVQLPGMMTGQIIGGVAPVEAVKYQVLVAWALLGATSLCCVIAAWRVSRRLTNPAQQVAL